MKSSHLVSAEVKASNFGGHDIDGFVMKCFILIWFLVISGERDLRGEPTLLTVSKLSGSLDLLA